MRIMKSLCHRHGHDGIVRKVAVVVKEYKFFGTVVIELKSRPHNIADDGTENGVPIHRFCAGYAHNHSLAQEKYHSLDFENIYYYGLPHKS